MDKFRVGQRVRIVKTQTGYEYLVGQVFTITEGMDWRYDSETLDRAYAYLLDGKCDRGNVIAADEESLRPLPDGWQTTTWDQCMWRPNAREAV